MSLTGEQRRRWLFFFLLAAGIVIADQLTKAWLRSWLAPNRPPIDIAGEFIRFANTQNRGGIFGLFGDSATILALASLLVIGGIVVYQARDGVRSRWLTVALGLLLGGAIGNLIDRLALGYVTDWVDMGIGSWRWYTFNVADAAISIALLLLILTAVLGERVTGRLEHAAG